MVGAYVMSYIKEGGLTAAVGKMLNTVVIELRLENECTKGIEQLWGFRIFSIIAFTAWRRYSRNFEMDLFLRYVQKLSVMTDSADG